MKDHSAELAAGDSDTGPSTTETASDDGLMPLANAMRYLDILRGKFHMEHLDGSIGSTRQVEALAYSCAITKAVAEIDRLRSTLAEMIKAEQWYRANEQMALQRLSDALSGGNAGTWDEVFHAADQVGTGNPATLEPARELGAQRHNTDSHMTSPSPPSAAIPSLSVMEAQEALKEAALAWGGEPYEETVAPAVEALIRAVRAEGPPSAEKPEDACAELIHQTIPDVEGTEPRPNICGKCFQPFIGDEPRVGRNCESQQYHLRDCVAENVLPPGALFAVTRLNTVVLELARGEATVGEYATAREALIRVCLGARNDPR